MSASHRAVPGPKPGFLGLNLVRQMRNELLDYPLGLARQYGDLVELRTGPVRAYFVNHPEFVREVLVTRSKSFRKLPRIVRAFRSIDGNGLVFSEGDFWLRQRRLVQPAFSTKRFSGYARVVVENAQHLADSWRQGSEIDVSKEMKRLALAIIAKTLFDVEIPEEAERIGTAIETLSEVLTRETSRIIPLPEWLPTSDNRRKHQATAVIDAVVRRVIRERRATGEDKGDFLSMLLNAVDEEGDGTGMTDEQARDEAVTLFNAGHDTSAAGLTWLWYLVATHREVEQKLRDEAQNALGGRTATYADMPVLRYATMVVKETLRLYPPTWGLIPREAIEDVPLGEYVIPKRSWIYIYPWILHHDPRFFPKPEQFVPERFAPGRVEQIPQHAYIPFGAGPHVCIGNTFATMEMVLAVSTIIQRVRLQLPADHPPVVPEPHVAIRPRGGLRMQVHEILEPALAR